MLSLGKIEETQSNEVPRRMQAQLGLDDDRERKEWRGFYPALPRREKDPCVLLGCSWPQKVDTPSQLAAATRLKSRAVRRPTPGFSASPMLGWTWRCADGIHPLPLQAVRRPEFRQVGHPHHGTASPSPSPSSPKLAPWALTRLRQSPWPPVRPARSTLPTLPVRPAR